MPLSTPTRNIRVSLNFYSCQDLTKEFPYCQLIITIVLSLCFLKRANVLKENLQNLGSTSVLLGGSRGQERLTPVTEDSVARGHLPSVPPG